MWTPNTTEHDSSLLGDLAPEKILLEYEGPRMFTARDPGGKLLLVYQCDEEGVNWRYLVVPFTESRLEDLESGRASIVQALNQPRAWFVDVDVCENTRVVREADVALLPPNYLPAPDAFLCRPALSLRVLGDEIKAGGTPLSILKNATERAMGAVRKLVEYLLQFQDPEEVSFKTLRAYSDMPVLGVSFSSLEIDLGVPQTPPNGSNLDERRHKHIVDELTRLLRQGVNWAAGETSLDNPGKNPFESLAILSALQELTPSGRGPIREIQIGGRLATADSRRVSFTRETRTRIRSRFQQQIREVSVAADDAIPYLIFPKWFEAIGLIQVVDSGNNRFTLRSLSEVMMGGDKSEGMSEEDWPFGDEINVQYSSRWENVILEALADKKRRQVVGRLTEPVQFIITPEQPANQPLYETVQIVQVLDDDFSMQAATRH
jgi:hypothetical protein